MGWQNIALHGGRVVSIRYDFDDKDFVYVFERDIEIDGWTVSRIVKVGGPRSSQYKYDIKNYLEFVITDPKGETGIKQYYYNSGDDEMPASHKTATIESIAFYLRESLIFQSCDWADYDAGVVVAKIGTICRQHIAKSEQLEQIKQIINALEI